MMKNKVRDIIYTIFVVINVVLFIIGIYDKAKNILSYEYKDTSSIQWKIDKLLLDEGNDKDMISNVNVTSNKHHRQESSHLRQRDTKKKHKYP